MQQFSTLDYAPARHHSAVLVSLIALFVLFHRPAEGRQTDEETPQLGAADPGAEG